MLVYGKNVLKELVNSDVKINKVYLLDSVESEIKKISEGLNVVYMDKNHMDKLCSSKHQGVIVDIEDYKYSTLNDILDNDFVVILDHLEDPHNFGAIIRTCEAAGVQAIIIPNKRSVEINATVMKVSAGALSNVKIASVPNLVNAINVLKKNNFWVYGTDMTNSEVYTEVSYADKTALVIGAEGDGISRLVRENCDVVVNIPMKGKVNSLNASVAAGVLIYEVVRQRK